MQAAVTLVRRDWDVRLGFAILPVALLFVAFLISWIWRVMEWPLLLHLPPVYLIVVGLLVVGAVVSLSRGTPPWTYLWVAEGLYGMGLVGGFALFTAYSPGGIVPHEVQGTYAWTLLGVNQLWVLLALVGALLLAERQRQDAIFFFALFLGAKVMSFPILAPGALRGSADAITSVLALIALIEGLVLVWLIYRFLRGVQTSWRPLWGLCGLVLADSLIKFWPILLRPESAGSNLRELGSVLGRAWLLDGGLLAATVVAVWVYLAFRTRAA